LPVLLVYCQFAYRVQVAVVLSIERAHTKWNVSGKLTILSDKTKTSFYKLVSAENCFIFAFVTERLLALYAKPA
jgi:hypothetical protein